MSNSQWLSRRNALIAVAAIGVGYVALNGGFDSTPTTHHQGVAVNAAITGLDEGENKVPAFTVGIDQSSREKKADKFEVTSLTIAPSIKAKLDGLVDSRPKVTSFLVSLKDSGLQPDDAADNDLVRNGQLKVTVFQQPSKGDTYTYSAKAEGASEGDDPLELIVLDPNTLTEWGVDVTMRPNGPDSVAISKRDYNQVSDVEAKNFEDSANAARKNKRRRAPDPIAATVPFVAPYDPLLPKTQDGAQTQVMGDLTLQWGSRDTPSRTRLKPSVQLRQTA